jgi:VTC domain
VRERLRDLVGGFEPVSLKALDARAALLRRIDNKYAVSAEQFARLAERLRSDHEALEIDGRRAFAYSTTYFDTPELRCFVDHIENRVPRFKARSRLYEDAGTCVFEVKLKRSADETDKRQIGYSEEDRRRLTEDALECLQSALADQGLDTPDELEATLTTAFDRVTLAARERSERLTCDLGVRLVGPNGSSVRMHRDLILVETKSEEGQSPADRELERMSVPTISVSKYRVGMSLVGGAQRFGPQPGGDLFS